VIHKGISDCRDDRNVLAALLRAVPAEMQVGLAVKETVKDAWEAIRSPLRSLQCTSLHC
jgi:hypothetical protein